MRKKVLVTGGAGYIGSHTVVELYCSGYLPIIIDNLCNSSKKNLKGINEILKTQIPFYKIDCNDLDKMQRVFDKYNDIYACIHFAAFKSVEESVANPKKYYKNNIGSLEVLLKCLQKNKISNLIFSSSCAVYGTPKKLPVHESFSFNKAESPYAETKQRCENLITKNSCNSICLRYFNPIGSHISNLIGDCSNDNSSNLVSVIIDVAIGARDKLIVNGNNYNTKDGTCIRDYIHVQDLALAHVKALNYILKNEVKDVFNVGTGKGLSVLDIINTFEEVNDLKINYEIGARRPGDIEKIFSSGEKIETFLGWKPIRTIDQALSSAWNWKISNKN